MIDREFWLRAWSRHLNRGCLIDPNWQPKGERLNGPTVITGQDARDFIKRMDSAVMTPEREAWLREAAEQSRQAEERGRRSLADKAKDSMTEFERTYPF